MTERFAYENRYLHGRKAPVPATCDAVEALVRREPLAHLPEWLSHKAGVLWEADLSTASTGKNCVLSLRLPNPSPVLDKNRAPIGPEILSSTAARVWRKAPCAFSDSSSVLDRFQSAILGCTSSHHSVHVLEGDFSERGCNQI